MLMEARLKAAGARRGEADKSLKSTEMRSIGRWSSCGETQRFAELGEEADDIDDDDGSWFDDVLMPIKKIASASPACAQADGRSAKPRVYTCHAAVRRQTVGAARKVCLASGHVANVRCPYTAFSDVTGSPASRASASARSAPRTTLYVYDIVALLVNTVERLMHGAPPLQLPSTPNLTCPHLKPATSLTRVLDQKT